jgi:small subunit ribosomal protein S20
MANSKSAEKRARQNQVRTARNRVVKRNLKEARRVFTEALESGDAKAAGEALSKASSTADRAAKAGVIHRNTASRLKSRLASALAK